MTTNSQKKVIYVNLVAWLLMLFTWVLFEKVEHYFNIGYELLQNHSFETGTFGWRLSGGAKQDAPEAVNLSNMNPSEGRYIRQTLPKPASGFVRVSADAQIVDVTVGEEVWQKARIDVLARKAGGQWRWDFPNTLFAEVGTMKVDDISAVFYIPEEFSEIRVESGLTGGVGTFVVHRLSLRAVEPRRIVKAFIHGLFGCWVILGIVSFGWLIKSNLWQPAVVMCLVSGILLVLPELLKQKLLEWFASITPGAGLPGFSLDHFLLFFGATLLILHLTVGYDTRHNDRRGNTVNIYLVVGCLVTFSLASEVMQYYSSHRNAGLVDGLTNIVGVMTAVVVLQLARMSPAVLPVSFRE